MADMLLGLWETQALLELQVEATQDILQHLKWPVVVIHG